MRPLRICVAGEWCWHFYEKSLCTAFEDLGYDTYSFKWNSYFKNFSYREAEPEYNGFLSKVQYYFKTGPKVWLLNHELIAFLKKNPVDVLFLYNQQFITPSTINKIRMDSPNIKIFQYSQDCAFSPNHEASWRHFRKCIPLVDVNFTVRSSDIQKFSEFGSKRTKLLKQFYDKKLDFVLNDECIGKRFFCDVVFAGHFEDDNRAKVVEAVVNAGFTVNVFGGGWQNYSGPKHIRDRLNFLPAIDRDYQQAICGAKVALAFLSKINNDEYTTRNFQIPAMGTPVVSEYSDSLSSLYKDGESILMFHDVAGAVNCIKSLVEDPEKCAELSKNASERLAELGMSSLDRARQILEEV